MSDVMSVTSEAGSMSDSEASKDMRETPLSEETEKNASRVNETLDNDDGTKKETLSSDKEVLVISEESVDSGIDESTAENSPFVTKAMIEEEEKLQRETEKLLQKQKREFEKQQHDKEMKEIRYKRLMHLLQKSEFYARFMHHKVNEFLKSEETKKSSSKGRERKRKHCAEEMVSACKKTKFGSEETNKTQDISILGEGELSDTNKLHKSYNDKVAVKEETVITSLGIEVPASQPRLLEGAALRDYQLDGLNWLKLLFESGLNGILADEMGLGKTVQVIGLICLLYERKINGPFLIVGPLSTLPNWLIEFNRFAPQLPVVLFHGSHQVRMTLRKDIRKKYSLGSDKVFPVVITSYEVPINDQSFFRSINWKYIIVDEGHRLKNHKSLLARALSSFNTVNRLLLTGTPLQNNLTELWSLLHFLIPEVFSSLDVFQSWFQVEDIERSDIAQVLVEQEKKENILSTLHKILSPFLLRRVKSEVNLKLPPKKEVLVYCPMSPIQRRLYELIIDKTILQMIHGPANELVIPDNPDGTKVKRRSALRPDNSSRRSSSPEPENELLSLVSVRSDCDQYVLEVKMQNVSMALRKTLNHPYLINMPVLPGTKILRIDEGIVTDSGKVAVLDGLLSRLKQRKHKVIIFSTFTTILDLLEELVIMRGYDYERLDGRCQLEARRTSIHRFNTDENVFLFLISTRAGGLGINLTAADTAIIFDSDWNPQADLQAQDRCHRIGQTKPVVVYRFITEGSLDEKIYSRATAKRKLEKIVIDGGKFNQVAKLKRLNTVVDLEELKTLLNSRPECRELRADGSVLNEDEWNVLLDRSDLLAAMAKNEEN